MTTDTCCTRVRGPLAFRDLLAGLVTQLDDKNNKDKLGACQRTSYHLKCNIVTPGHADAAHVGVCNFLHTIPCSKVISSKLHLGTGGTPVFANHIESV